MTGHHSSYLGWQIHRVWWPRSESFDNVAVHGGVTVHDFIVSQWIKINSVPIWFQSISKGGLVQCAFNLHRPKPNQVWTQPMIRLKCLVWKGLKTFGLWFRKIDIVPTSIALLLSVQFGCSGLKVRHLNMKPTYMYMHWSCISLQSQY